MDISLDFLLEPAFVLRRHGEILSANLAARRLLAAEACARNLADWIVGTPDAFQELLRRASRSTSPTVASLVLRSDEQDRTFRVYAARLPGEGEARLVLHCRSATDDQFALLTRRVRELDTQLRKRLQEKAALEESLRQNQTLLRELQHRVKNNIQLMVSLIRMSVRRRENAPARLVVEPALMRLQALASAQEAIYRSAAADRVLATDFLEELVAVIVDGFAVGGRVEAKVEQVALPSDEAHCLALILNELLTNAIKYGLRDGQGRIEVDFGRAGDDLRLVVRDDGAGIGEAAAASSSGLQIVRSLCRQIGGRLEIGPGSEAGSGTTCSVQFATRSKGR